MRYVQHPETLELIPADEYVRPSRGQLIIGDIEPFKSPLDGTTITGRAALRRHMKEHNVTHADDFKDTWKKAAGDRERFYNPDKAYDRKARVEAIKHAIEVHR